MVYKKKATFNKSRTASSIVSRKNLCRCKSLIRVERSPIANCLEKINLVRKLRMRSWKHWENVSRGETAKISSTSLPPPTQSASIFTELCSWHYTHVKKGLFFVIQSPSERGKLENITKTRWNLYLWSLSSALLSRILKFDLTLTHDGEGFAIDLMLPVGCFVDPVAFHHLSTVFRLKWEV